MPQQPQIARRHSQLILGPDGGITVEIPRPPHTLPKPKLTTVQQLERSHANRPGSQPDPTRNEISRLIKSGKRDATGCQWGPEPRYDLTPIEASFRHGGWHARRVRVAQALADAGASPRRRENFSQCGAGAYVFVERTTGQVRVEASYCKDRFCQPCQQARATRIALALQERVPRHKCVHLVLTLKSSDTPLGEQLTRLFNCSTRLRASKFWRSHAIGGSQTFEVTLNEDTGLWHPHLHLLVHADYLRHDLLVAEWLKATGDSDRVHVSLVTNSTAAVREVTKYLGKPIHRSVDCNSPKLAELIISLKGRRLIGTFGSWRHDPLLRDDYEDDGGQWERWGSLVLLHQKAAAGDTWARLSLAYLHSLAAGRDRQPPPPVPPSG